MHSVIVKEDGHKPVEFIEESMDSAIDKARELVCTMYGGVSEQVAMGIHFILKARHRMRANEHIVVEVREGLF